MNRRGQTLLEALLGITLAATAGAGVTLLIRGCLEKAACANGAFRAARSALEQPGTAPAWRPGGRRGIQITRLAGGVLAEARCGKATETVKLPELEAWNP